MSVFVKYSQPASWQIHHAEFLKQRTLREVELIAAGDSLVRLSRPESDKSRCNASTSKINVECRQDKLPISGV